MSVPLPAGHRADRSGFWLPPFFVLAVLLVASRRPDVILHATFWAEDGWQWYPDAYAQGWRSLLHPWTGYLQTLSRMVAILCQPFPLSWAPTLFAAAAIAVQAATATFMLSARLDRICPGRAVRAVFALLYLLLPNSFEVYANLTNAQWHLALWAFLVCVGRSPAGPAGRLLDALVLILSGLSGPCCILLLPVALLVAARRRDRAAIERALLVSLCCLVQLWCLFGNGASRAAPLLGAGPRRLALILSLQVILPLLLGRHGTTFYQQSPYWQDGLIPCLVAAGAAVLTLRALLSGPPLVRLACLFAGGVMAAALLRPAIGSPAPAWHLMSMPDVGDRYYLLPMLAWAVVLFALAADHAALFRWIARALLLLLAVTLPGDWHLPTSFPIGGRTDFVPLAHAFARAPAGTEMRFPVHPLGMRPMVLRKH